MLTSRPLKEKKTLPDPPPKDELNLLRAIVQAEQAEDDHKCKEHPKWCNHYDLGCDESYALFDKKLKAWDAWEKAVALAKEQIK